MEENQNKAQAHRESKGVKPIGMEGMTMNEMMSQCFYYMNAFKRHRALANIKRLEGDKDKANFHELKQYQFIDSLELSMRALQKGQREITDED